MSIHPCTGYGTTVFSPLAASLLTGKYNNGIPSDSRYATTANDPFIKSLGEELSSEVGKAKIAKVQALEKIAKEEFPNASTAQLALAWAAKNPRVGCRVLFDVVLFLTSSFFVFLVR